MTKGTRAGSGVKLFQQGAPHDREGYIWFRFLHEPLSGRSSSYHRLSEPVIAVIAQVVFTQWHQHDDKVSWFPHRIIVEDKEQQSSARTVIKSNRTLITQTTDDLPLDSRRQLVEALSYKSDIMWFSGRHWEDGAQFTAVWYWISTQTISRFQ